MEPASIDWKNVDSRFARDDLFEHFNAPKWVDLSFPPAADDSLFCRPDCRHPKTHEDFLKKPPPTPDLKGRKVLGERNPKPNANANANVKRRGAHQPSMTPLLTPPRAKPTTYAKKKAREDRGDLENQNPNLPPALVPSTPSKAVSKIAKEAVKSSAEKPSREAEAEAAAARPQLRSTRSARNLFAGKEILAQISEFCSEVRRMAMARREKGGILEEEEEEEQGRRIELRSEEGSEKDEKKMVASNNNSTGECLKLLQQEVRSCPPTPQRFPSPMATLHKQSRAGTPKPSRAASPERTILKQLVLNKGEEDDEIEEESKGEGCSSSSNNIATVSRALDMFWFLKPCTYLA